MSCTIDRFNADFGTKEHAIAFIKLFNEMLKGDLCVTYEMAESDVVYKYGKYSLEIEESPWFIMVERGAQLQPVVERFLKENQDADFYAFYSCAFTNCGDTTYIDYSYNDGVLTIDTRWGELPYETYCEECGYDAEEDFDEDDEDEEVRYIVDLETWEEDKTYKCPQCGAIIEFEAAHDVKKIKIK